MRRIALLSLAHDRGKLVASLAGVAFAATLVMVQVGIYVGFLKNSSAIITHVGGDVWVMARGTEVVDSSEALAAGSRSVVASHPCVRSVRAVVLQFMAMRKPAGARDVVVIVGYEPDAGPMIPWNFARGLPQALHGPMRVAVDKFELPKLQIRGDPIGAQMEVSGQIVHVAAITEGIRAFTLSPYVFAEMPTARMLAGLAEGQASFWIADLHDRSCLADVIRAVDRHPDLQAMSTAAWAHATEEYWVGGSGAGTALGFSALLGLVVGAVIVGQTLYAVTKEHLRELATLKAVGASNREIVGFVAWQAGFLALVGGAIGFLLTVAVKHGIEGIGLTVAMTPGSLAVGVGAVLFMVVTASLWSVRTVIVLEAAEVFK